MKSNDNSYLLHLLSCGIMLLSLLTFQSCSSDDQAGVITDTHTKTSISGIIQNSSNTPISARVRLVSPVFSSTTNSPEFETTSDSNGFFRLDSIPFGDWNLIATDSANNLTKVIALIGLVDKEYHFDKIVASTGAKIILDLNYYNLKAGTSVYIPGTDAGIVIDDAMIANGTASLELIPNGIPLVVTAYSNDSAITLSSITPVVPGEILLNVNGSVTTSTKSLMLSFPDSILNLADVQNMPFPVRLPNTLIKPCLIDQNDNVIALDSAWSGSDYTVYWGSFPTLSVSNSIKYNVFENCTTSTNMLNSAALRLSAHMDDASDSLSIWGNSLWLDSTSGPYMFNSFYPFIDSSDIGLSFWIRMDGANQAGTYMQIFDSHSNASGVRIQQGANLNSIQIRVDTKDGAYNAIFGKSAILDGAWHQFAFNILGNAILVAVDGNVVTDTTFDAGSGFTNSYNPLIGNIPPNLRGHIDEFMFFDGSQNASWWKILYALQKPTVHWILSDSK